jgi:serine/threonine-protein kinase HipA
MTLAEVNLWGSRIGAVRQDAPETVAVFEYDPRFLESGIEPSPLRMPNRAGLFEFPALPRGTFGGLPGMLWDSLPDRFGERLITRYFEATGRPASELNAVQKLCYVGVRGMGALEYSPAVDRAPLNEPVDVERLAEFAAIALSDDTGWASELVGDGMAELLEVGTSAGGARPKAVIAWNPDTNEVRSGRVDLDAGFQYWLLKFDGVGAADREFGRSLGYGVVEYAYSLLARDAGIDMTECRLFEEGGRRHFMTRRFDRRSDGTKLHMQTLAGLAHIDFNQPGAGSYEDAFNALRAIGASGEEIEQQFVRMVFNVVARNQDDHAKNISFLMDKRGDWVLSPAYDISFAFNPAGQFTSRHQLSLNGKLDGISRADLEAVADRVGLVRGRWKDLSERVVESVSRWREVATDVGVPVDKVDAIEAQLQLKL